MSEGGSRAPKAAGDRALPIPFPDVLTALEPRIWEELGRHLRDYDIEHDEISRELERHEADLALATEDGLSAWQQALAEQTSAEELSRRAVLTGTPPRLVARSRRLSRAWSRRRARRRAHAQLPSFRELAAAADAARAAVATSVDAWKEAAYVSWALPLARALLNDRAQPGFRSRLPAEAGSGLSEVFRPTYEVPTSATSKLLSLLERMPGGSIGLCGLRGCGKSTLIRSICATRSDGSSGGSIGFVVSAPVRYDAREFLLYLFSRLCEEILGEDPGARRPVAPGPRDDWRTRSLGAAAVALVMVAVGATEIAVAATGGSWAGVVGSGPVRIAVGAALAAAGVVVVARVRSYRLRRLDAEADLPFNARRYRRAVELRQLYGADETATLRVVETADWWLRELRYQSTYTTGWSGMLTTAVARAGVTASTETADRQRALPDFVAGFRSLVSAVHGMQTRQRRIRLFIGIDELDKIASDDDAQRFVNEIKAIFGVDGCFYLVSVSENAMSSFERRGLPFRDAFDSAFDEVVRFDRFTFDLSRELLKRRAVLPLPYTALCHCVSGGLPRDLIRTARTLFRLNTSPGTTDTVDALALALVVEDVRAKTAAMSVDLARIDAEPEATRFGYLLQQTEQWLEQVPATTAAAAGEALLKQCRGFWADAAQWPRTRASDGAARAARSRLAALGLEATAYHYFAATLLDFFCSYSTDNHLRTAARVNAGPASIENLARARLLFANGPLVAWELISEFRGAHHRDVLETPDPCWLDPWVADVDVTEPEAPAPAYPDAKDAV